MKKPHMHSEPRVASDAGSSEIGEVFISYSWDSKEHIARVLALSNRLRSEGIDCVLDQYEASPPEGWPRWMDRKIRDAKFVLMICTEDYYNRVMGQEAEGIGLGVRWEGGLIYQHLYNAGATNVKFLPVLFDPKDSRFIPTPVQGATRYGVDTDNGYDELYFRLLDRPRVEKPKLGKRRPLPKRDIKTDIAAYLTIPIDVELWDRAKWRSTIFAVSNNDKLPPILGLGFLNEAPAREIFRQWHKRYGDRDLFEELRVSIIEGDIPGRGSGYSVHIGPDVLNTIKRYQAAGLTVRPDADLFISVSRINRMNPAPTSRNLEMFKQGYGRFNEYLLAPGTAKPDGSEMRLFPDLGILKREIKFRRVEEIGSNDEDSAVL